MEATFKRDRLIVIALLGTVTLLGWAYMVREARGMTLTGACCCAGMKMSGPATNPWATSTLIPLFLMWAEMMAAMMLPSATPMILAFVKVQRNRREQQRPFAATGIFVLGYLAAWTGFSALAAVLQWILNAKALLSPMMVSTSSLLAGGLLVVAGVFQWTKMKNACLKTSCSPVGFVTTSWREGKWGALQMGLRHGVYCLGCCWVLMLLLFVAGVMNIWWIGVITILVLIEKLVPRGLWLGRFAGVLFAAWGLWLICVR